MSLRQCMEEVSPAEFDYWIAYSRLEPFGPLQEDLRAGTLAVASLAPWSKEGRTPKAHDFFPSLRPESETEWGSPEGQMLIGRMYALAFDGMD